ncbi:MAG: DUF3047 domain-containing protein [Comamonadaceae bacterium]|nr:MAG: DUF3047 domain-containing protein [Comamonadaceae bacterium]
MTRHGFWRTAAVLALASGTASGQGAGLADLVPAAGTAPPPAWRLVSLPEAKKIPPTRFDIAEVDGERVLRVRTSASYANLVHAWQGPVSQLQWRWRLEQALPGADLRSKQGDDVALKVCLLFHMPLSAVPFGERAGLALARAISGEPLPAATLCYVWDTRLPPGTLIPNAYSARVRYLVLASGPPTGQWQAQQRDVAADFRRAFGAETATVPAVSAVAVGGDADNTSGASTAFLADLRASP